MVRAAVADLVAGVAPGLVSARFHATMAEVAAAMVRRASPAVGGRVPVVLTGGCFQNALLVESVCRRLAGDFEVRLHGQVPPGDGGIALGQAVVADAVVTAGAARLAVRLAVRPARRRFVMDGTLVLTGRVASVVDGPDGRVGRVSVRGAMVDVALDLVPEAGEGDTVLVHAGVALSIVREDEAAVAAVSRAEEA